MPVFETSENHANFPVFSRCGGCPTLHLSCCNHLLRWSVSAALFCHLPLLSYILACNITRSNLYQPMTASIMARKRDMGLAHHCTSISCSFSSTANPGKCDWAENTKDSTDRFMNAFHVNIDRGDEPPSLAIFIGRSCQLLLLTK